jgi:hypothetical protein
MADPTEAIERSPRDRVLRPGSKRPHAVTELGGGSGKSSLPGTCAIRVTVIQFAQVEVPECWLALTPRVRSAAAIVRPHAVRIPAQIGAP